MNKKPQTFNLSELRAGFEGKPFCNLIENHLYQQNQDRRIQGFNWTTAMLPEEARGLVGGGPLEYQTTSKSTVLALRRHCQQKRARD